MPKLEIKEWIVSFELEMFGQEQILYFYAVRLQNHNLIMWIDLQYTEKSLFLLSAILFHKYPPIGSNEFRST